MKNSEKIDYLLQHLTSLLARNSDQILLEQLGFGYAQYKLLRALDIEKPKKQRQISSTLGQTEASISRQVKILISKGYILRREDPNSKRTKLIKLTIKGQEITGVAEEILTKYHENLLASFDDKKQTALLSLLETLHSDICAVDHDEDVDYISFITSN